MEQSIFLLQIVLSNEVFEHVQGAWFQQSDC